MSNHLEIARRFISDQLNRRNDLVAAFVVGSVARGEETEFSDIDLSLIVDDTEANHEMERSGSDAWIDGIYVEAATSSRDRYADLEQVMQNPVTSTHMNDALILHDPTGFYSQLQKDVRTVFMDPEWLDFRVRIALERARSATRGLDKAIAVGDGLSICEHVMGFLWGVTSVPLLRTGITPSSMRALGQLGPVSSNLKSRISVWECSSTVSTLFVLVLHSILSDGVALVDASKWGHLPEYAVKKMEWMANNGLHTEAMHAMWIGMGVYGAEWRRRGDVTVGSEELILVQVWLGLVGWDGTQVLAQKLATAKSILAEVEALAADLPMDTASRA